jgi:hypothetical protein
MCPPGLQARFSFAANRGQAPSDSTESAGSFCHPSATTLAARGAKRVYGLPRVILVPVGGDLLDAASEIIQGRGSMEAFTALAGRERMFGAANLLLALVTIFISVLKPALWQSRN